MKNRTLILLTVSGILIPLIVASWAGIAFRHTREAPISPTPVPVVSRGNDGNVPVGGDRDAHGCIGSAGYSWCGEKNKCLRVWEEDCPSLKRDGETCAVETCHGLDVACGSNPPQVCTDMYALGDKCLRYAKCGVRDGSCRQVEDPRFTECASCVRKCVDSYGNDAMKQFECEGKCE